MSKHKPIDDQVIPDEWIVVPDEWIVIDTDGSRAIKDFADLYVTTKDKYGRVFGHNALEFIANIISKFNGLIDIDVTQFEALLLTAVEYKLLCTESHYF
jgi:hypothetical protein